jgi:hypothetical protein
MSLSSSHSTNVYISCASGDLPLANAIVKALSKWDIHPSSDPQTADSILFVATPESLSSTLCLDDVRFAAECLYMRGKTVANAQRLVSIRAAPEHILSAFEKSHDSSFHSFQSARVKLPFREHSLTREVLDELSELLKGTPHPSAGECGNDGRSLPPRSSLISITIALLILLSGAITFAATSNSSTCGLSPAISFTQSVSNNPLTAVDIYCVATGVTAEFLICNKTATGPCKPLQKEQWGSKPWYMRPFSKDPLVRSYFSSDIQARAIRLSTADVPMSLFLLFMSTVPLFLLLHPLWFGKSLPMSACAYLGTRWPLFLFGMGILFLLSGTIACIVAADGYSSSTIIPTMKALDIKPSSGPETELPQGVEVKVGAYLGSDMAGAIVAAIFSLFSICCSGGAFCCGASAYTTERGEVLFRALGVEYNLSIKLSSNLSLASNRVNSNNNVISDRTPRVISNNAVISDRTPLPSIDKVTNDQRFTTSRILPVIETTDSVINCSTPIPIRSPLAQKTPVLFQTVDSFPNMGGRPRVRVFLSHQWNSKFFVKSINSVLQALGIDTWMDSADMAPGDEMYREIMEGIEASDVVIAFITPEYLSSANCMKEIDVVVRKQMPILLLDLGVWKKEGKMYLPGQILKALPQNHVVLNRFPLLDMRKIVADQLNNLINKSTEDVIPFEDTILSHRLVRLVERLAGASPPKSAYVRCISVQMPATVLISYAGKDLSHANWIRSILSPQGCSFVSCKAEGGQSDDLARADVVIVILSQAYYDSSNCIQEASETAADRRRCIVLLIDERASWPPTNPDLARALTGRLYVDFRKAHTMRTEEMEKSIQSVIDGVMLRRRTFVPQVARVRCSYCPRLLRDRCWRSSSVVSTIFIVLAALVGILSALAGAKPWGPSNDTSVQVISSLSLILCLCASACMVLISYASWMHVCSRNGPLVLFGLEWTTTLWLVGAIVTFTSTVLIGIAVGETNGGGVGVLILLILTFLAQMFSGCMGAGKVLCCSRT